MENVNNLPKRLCSVDGCGGKYCALGYCAKHRWRFRKYGDATYHPPRAAGCNTPGCDGEHYAKGLCKNCYQRKRQKERNKDPEYRKRAVKYTQKYRKRHLEKVRQYDFEYYRRPAVRARKAARDQSPEAVRRRADYQKSVKGKLAATAMRHRRRAATNRVLSNVTTAWLDWLWRSTSFCESCGKLFMLNIARHLDHIHPLRMLGTDTQDNVRYLCSTCNVRRPRDGSDCPWHNLQTLCCLRISAVMLKLRCEFDGQIIAA